MTAMKVYDDVSMSLGTLASGAVIKGATKIDAAREQGTILKKIMAQCSVNGKTAGEGPLIVGLCNVDLSTVEIAEALAADPQKGLDTPASEQVEREIMIVWMVGRGITSDAEITPFREVKYPWKEVIEGNGLAWFVMNAGASGLTDSSFVSVFSFIHGEWMRD